jgi:hypothetical protein
MALLAVLANPYKEALSFMNVKAATPAEKDLLRLTRFPQVRSKISRALARKGPIDVHISGPRGEFVRFRMSDPKKYQSFALMVLSPKELRGLRPSEARARLGVTGFRRLTLGVIGRLGPGKSELQSVLVPKQRVFDVARTYLAKPAAARVAMNPRYPGVLGNRRRSRRNPHDIATAWTGKKADYVSPVGDYGAVGYSELAMHVGASGKRVVQFALWSEKDRWPNVTWAQIKTSDGKITDGTPHEVLPPDVLRSLPGSYDRPKLPHRGQKMMFNRRRVRRNPVRYAVRDVLRRRDIATAHTAAEAHAYIAKIGHRYPAGSLTVVQEQTRYANNPRLGERVKLSVPFRSGKKYSVEAIDRWVRSVAIPAITKRWEQAISQYKRFHRGSMPNSVTFNVQHLGVSSNITDVDFGVSEGKEWMAPYQVPKHSGKYEGDGSQGRYVHAHGDSEIEVNIKRPVSTRKLPERFHTPDGKFVGVIPSKQTRITDWYYH